MKKSIETFNNTKKTLKAYEYAMWVLAWDQETETPVNAFDYRTKQIEILTQEMYKVETDKDYLDSIDLLFAFKERLEPVLKAEVKSEYKKLRILRSVPKDEYIAYQVLLSHSNTIWEKAKKENNFELFLPTLETIIEYNQKLCRYLETDELKGYDVLLDMYEEGYTIKDYDALFDLLKKELVPFVTKVAKTMPPVPKKLAKGHFDIDRQRIFSEYLVDVFKFDRTQGVFKESAHPFTTSVTASDVRFTTRYLSSSIESAIFSTLHELGHAIYDQNIGPDLAGTFVANASSLGIHESQSRFYENMLGKSFFFWEMHYPKLQELFPKELKNIDLTSFYIYLNRVERTTSRMDADELTYPLHIMVRYDIEKELFNGKLKAKDIPRRWRTLYQEYVGIRPKTDTEGCLSDIHWASGMFGYFPTYTLGSAYAAQIYHKMNKDLDIENVVADNQIELINDWLKAKVHQFGAVKTPKEIILEATGEEFKPKYFIDYLRNKFDY